MYVCIKQILYVCIYVCVYVYIVTEMYTAIYSQWAFITYLVIK